MGPIKSLEWNLEEVGLYHLILMFFFISPFPGTNSLCHSQSDFTGFIAVHASLFHLDSPFETSSIEDFIHLTLC